MRSTEGTREGGSYSIVGLRVKYWELLLILLMSNKYIPNKMVSVSKNVIPISLVKPEHYYTNLAPPTTTTRTGT